jgi:hypothetical protein
VREREREKEREKEREIQRYRERKHTSLPGTVLYSQKGMMKSIYALFG